MCVLNNQFDSILIFNFALKTESIIKTDLANLFYKRFDNKPALTANEHWFGALRLAQEFNEHPITFKRRWVRSFFCCLVYIGFISL